MRRNLTLNKNYAFVGRESYCEKQSVHISYLLAEFLRILTNGDCMKIGNSERAVILRCDIIPVFESPEIVSESRCSAGLNEA